MVTDSDLRGNGRLPLELFWRSHRKLELSGGRELGSSV